METYTFVSEGQLQPNDGACPLCFKSKSWLINAVDKNIKLTAVDLNSEIARQKGISNNSVALEANGEIYLKYFSLEKELLGNIDIINGISSFY